MPPHARCLNSYDVERIRGFLVLATARGPERYRHLLGLKEDLEGSLLLAPEEMPADVVSMNSRVRIAERGGGPTELTLVFPQEADYEQRKVSLLAPLGAAILGRRVGEEVSYQTPGGTTRILIESILYQPEAAGEYWL